jgi:predicted 3-demethylubiquinone-9 3-methyltransferase (glyoxalase superfamily)
MQKITPCLWFEKNNAEEAMQFYTSVFPDSKIVSIERYPEGYTEGPLAGMSGKVITGIFELFGQQFMCLDGGPLWSFTGAISFQVECDSQEELEKYWAAISADPASEQCGWCKDKFGLSWQIVPKRLGELLQDPDKAKAKRVMDAMMEMKKIDLPTLEKAAAGE